MMTHFTPEEAATMDCPVARIKPITEYGKCCGPRCILWRWRQRKTSDEGWLKAMKAAREETGENPNSHPKAAALVARDPDRFGLGPQTGYCGLGGIPHD